MKKLRIHLCVATAMLLAAPTLQAHNIYVSPQGVDSNTGTEANPVATITAARNLMRASGKLGSQTQLQQLQPLEI